MEMTSFLLSHINYIDVTKLLRIYRVIAWHTLQKMCDA